MYALHAEKKKNLHSVVAQVFTPNLEAYFPAQIEVFSTPNSPHLTQPKVWEICSIKGNQVWDFNIVWGFDK